MSEAQMHQPLLEVKGLKEYFDINMGFFRTKPLKAVDDVSFTINKGETLGLVGESGCGKSTVGRQLVGLEKPTGGRLFYQGKDMEKLSGKEKKSVRTQLQMVFQDPYSSLNPRKHIYEILSQPMLYHGISNKETVHRDVDRLLDMVGLPKHVLGRYPHEFSGGQRQRISLARAILKDAPIVVLDEATAYADPENEEKMEAAIAELVKGKTLVVIAHKLPAIMNADQICVMDHGKLVATGRHQELIQSCPEYQKLWKAAQDSAEWKVHTAKEGK